MEKKPEKRSYHHITYDDRKQIEKMLSDLKRNEEIAVAVGVSESTIRREIKRGGKPYRADIAQKFLYSGKQANVT